MQRKAIIAKAGLAGLALFVLLICAAFLVVHLLSIKSEEEIPIKYEEEVSVTISHEVMYQNPLKINNIGDPFVLKASDGKYYCYATSAYDGYLVWISEDLVNWESKGHAYRTDYTSWAGSDFWAPEVYEHNGRYIMFYSARWQENGSLRIGTAVSSSPLGPFTDTKNEPMFDFGYAAIDANVLIDGDKNYLFYSRDCSENIIDGRPESHIYGVELSDDLLSIKGEPVLLLKPDQDWEFKSGGYLWNEAPFSFAHNGKYYLMYSANFYGDMTYSVGYATASSPLGVYVKSEENPILESVPKPAKADEDDIALAEISGPGHNCVTTSPDGSEFFVVYHTHMDAFIAGGDRQVCIDRMTFDEDGSIHINGPTMSPQPFPSGAATPQTP